MSEKRLRSSYVLYRRYKKAAEAAAIAGAAIGMALTTAALMPAISGGETVPPSSFVIGLFIIVALAGLPYLAIRWRWRQIKSQLDD